MKNEYTLTDDERLQMEFLLAVLAYTDRDFVQFKNRFSMTQELWEHCLWVCMQDGDIMQYNKLWNDYPQFAEALMREFEDTAP